MNISCLSNHVVPLADSSHGCRMVQQAMITDQQRILINLNLDSGVLLLEKPNPSLTTLMMGPNTMKHLEKETSDA